jgi:hypothetical protein
MTELPTPDHITYEWIERESQLFSCRATLDRERLQAWIDRSHLHIQPEELDADDIGEYLDANPDEAISARWRPGDEVLIEPFDAKVVQP